jgi:hypothetical protein
MLECTLARFELRLFMMRVVGKWHRYCVFLALGHENEFQNAIPFELVFSHFAFFPTCRPRRITGRIADPNYLFFVSAEMPQPRSQLYNFVFRRNATFMSAMIVGAFVLEYTGGGIVDRLWNSWNKGVRIQFDISIPTDSLGRVLTFFFRRLVELRFFFFFFFFCF